MAARIRNEIQELGDSIKGAGKNMEAKLIQLHNKISTLQEASPLVPPANEINAMVERIIEGLAKKPRADEVQQPRLDLGLYVHRGSSSIVKRTAPLCIRLVEMVGHLEESVILDPSATTTYTSYPGQDAQRWPTGHKVPFTLGWLKTGSTKNHRVIGRIETNIKVVPTGPLFKEKLYLTNSHSSIITVLGRDFMPNT